MGYARSQFRDFESYLRIVVGLQEDDIQIILKQPNGKYITYELSPDINQITGVSETVYKTGDHEETLQLECDDITRKTKLILTRCGSTIGTLRFDEKSFLYTFLGFTTFWDFKPTNANNADSPGKHISGKNFKYNR